jgi:hypothetical protein
MMSEATVLESRVDKLEQDNRRLKLTVGALLLALAAGAVMSQRIPELIQAQRFEVIGENGTTRVRIDEVEIAYSDALGTVGATMSADGIAYFDENGNLRARTFADGIGYSDENGTNRVGIAPFGIFYSDENGNLVWSTACGFPPC